MVTALTLPVTNPPLEASNGVMSTEICFTVSIEKVFRNVGWPLSFRPKLSFTETPSIVMSFVLGLLPMIERLKKSSELSTATLGSKAAISCIPLSADGKPSITSSPKTEPLPNVMVLANACALTTTSSKSAARKTFTFDVSLNFVKTSVAFASA